MYDKALLSTLGVCLLFALISLPLILRKVPRNHVYGFRTPATLRSDFIWFEANAHGGWGVLISSFISAFAELALYTNGRSLEPQTYLGATVAALVVPMFIATILTMLYIGRLKRS